MRHRHATPRHDSSLRQKRVAQFRFLARVLFWVLLVSGFYYLLCWNQMLSDQLFEQQSDMEEMSAKIQQVFYLCQRD